MIMIQQEEHFLCIIFKLCVCLKKRIISPHIAIEGSNSAVVAYHGHPGFHPVARGTDLWKFVSRPSTLETVSLVARMTRYMVVPSH